ncbi:sigma-70 family RNA polymerase sigma factor [Alicyclobacillus tolerans]|uniref:sigma-70 family RNA polymerase sigma factor n=1 Tax=Alicyclobacillus tolerans TaxID=90970 RepID=UPI003557B4F0|nr:sigma-70 family RNA polymerase sigma factor [Alicyclobacillus tolerans]
MIDGSSSKELIRSLYDLYSNDVYRYAWATLGDSTEAHDVVQEVFLRAYRSLNSYRHDASAKTWLMTIARNYIFDVLR